MKYFLTGATGFVGGRLAKLLREKGHEVVALVRNPAKASDLTAIGVALAPGDITDPASMRGPMQGCDGVFHVAGWYKVGVRDKSEGEKINIEGTRNVLTLMREFNIPKGVYTSTLAVNSDTQGRLPDETFHFTGTHVSEYDRTKAVAHDIANGFIREGLPLVVVMPGLIYGPGDTSSVRTTILNFLQGKLPAIPNKSAYCWAHVDDIAQAHLLAMEKGRAGENYIIAGPPHTLVEAMQMASQVSGKKMPAVVPSGLLRGLAPVMGLLEKIFPVPPDYSAENLRVTGGVTYLGNNSKAKRELGYNPRPLSEGWPETIRHEMELLEK
jgi:nucleoside-diphosphate-sugar epimerase